MDARPRMDGIAALDLYNFVIDVGHSSPSPIGMEKPDAMRSQCEKHPKNPHEVETSHVGRMCLRSRRSDHKTFSPECPVVYCSGQ